MHSFSIKEEVLYGWEVFKKRFAFIVGVLVFVYAITFSLQFFAGFFEEFSPFVSFVLAVVATLLSIIFNMGLITVALKLARTEPAAFDDLFDPIPRFFSFLGGSILYGLIVFFGFLLFIVPGIYWALKYMFFQYLIIDRDMAPFAALHASGEMTKNVKLKLLLLSVALGLLNLIGALALGVGLLITVPIGMIAFAHVYDNLRMRHEAERKAPVERYHAPAPEPKDVKNGKNGTRTTQNSGAGKPSPQTKTQARAKQQTPKGGRRQNGKTGGRPGGKQNTPSKKQNGAPTDKTNGPSSNKQSTSSSKPKGAPKRAKSG